MCSNLTKLFDFQPSTKLLKYIDRMTIKATSTSDISRAMPAKETAYLLTMPRSLPLSKKKKMEINQNIGADETQALVAKVLQKSISFIWSYLRAQTRTNLEREIEG